MRGGTGRPGAMLASPVFSGSIALLLLNDRVLKPEWPGLLVGAWMWKELPSDDVDGLTGLSAIAIAFALGSVG